MNRMTDEMFRDLGTIWRPGDKRATIAAFYMAYNEATRARESEAALREALNAAELRGQETGYDLAMSRVRAWVEKHQISGSSIQELEEEENRRRAGVKG